MDVALLSCTTPSPFYLVNTHSVEAAACYGLRMVVRPVPRAEACRPPLYLPGYFNPWSTFYSVRTHQGFEHHPNVPKRTRSIDPVNHSESLHQRNPHQNQLCLGIRIMRYLAPTASQEILLGGTAPIPFPIQKRTKTKGGFWKMAHPQVMGSAGTARTLWLSRHPLLPAATSVRSPFVESQSQTDVTQLRFVLST